MGASKGRLHPRIVVNGASEMDVHSEKGWL